MYKKNLCIYKYTIKHFKRRLCFCIATFLLSLFAVLKLKFLKAECLVFYKFPVFVGANDFKNYC